MLRLFFRLFFILFGAALLFWFGSQAVKSVYYRFSGITVTGRVMGFLSGKGSNTVVQEPTGIRRGKRKARRPVYVFPIAENSTDSMTINSNMSTTFSVLQFELNEPVTVVFPTAQPEKALLFNWRFMLAYVFGMGIGIVLVALGFSIRRKAHNHTV